MKKSTLFIFVLLFLFVHKVEAQEIDSLDITSTYITVGETWYTAPFTWYSVYTDRSFFKDENGGLHAAFLANYKLYYCYSADGVTWSSEYIMSTYDGDFKEAVIYADAAGNPYIAATVNPYFNYGTHNGMTYGNEFRYSVYYFFKDQGSWVQEEVYNSTLNPSFSGNYGCRVNELYKNTDGEMVLVGSRYGWYTYGGAFWEFKRNTAGTWSDLSIIHTFSDTPIDKATEVSRSFLKSTGERHLIYSRPYNASGLTELAYMTYTNNVWSAPTVLTTDLINHGAWDMSISANEEMYLIHYSNTPTPHVNMYTDFSGSTQLNVDLSTVTEIQSAKIHITEDGILDLLVFPTGTDTAILYASEDYGLTWTAPISKAREDLQGVLPVTDQFSSQGTDLEIIRVSRASNTEPYGPVTLYYNHAEHINSLGINDYDILTDTLALYPNPFSDMLTLNYTLREMGELNMNIYNLQGKKIVDRTYEGNVGENEFQMNLGYLESGIYIIEVIELNQTKGNLQRVTKKLIKF